MLTWPMKDPNEILDYQLDWADPESPRLDLSDPAHKETLVSSVFSIVEGDVVIESQSFAATGLTTVWLSGGTDGTLCEILNRVETSGGRTYDQSVRLRIRSR